MATVYYFSAFIVSLLLAAVFVFKWHKHLDVNFTMVFTLIPIACVGYVLYSQSVNLEEAIAAMKIIYIGGCFLQLFIMLSIFNLCKIDLNRWLRLLFFVISGATYLSVLTMGHSNLFYKNIIFDNSNGYAILIREYGVLHSVFYVVLCSYFVIGIAVIIYAWFRKKQAPRTVIALLVIPDMMCLLSYFLGRRLIQQVELVPAGYLIAEMIFLLIAYRISLYDVSETVIESMVREREIGYASFDFKYRFLGCNEIASQLVPGLKDVAVDEVIKEKEQKIQPILGYLDSFKTDESSNLFLYSAGERYYNANVNYLYESGRKRGYLVTFTDDTPNRKYIQLLDTYNENLRCEVDEKTRHIVEMHDNLIMSLAVMVESRDNSTGGHIKRTSEGVRILVDEIRRKELIPLSPEFCDAIVKAAPMHDLGKIAVDDAILRKPGRFTEEEFEKMKHHAAEGARVIHEILLNTDDELFKTVAENVAHYHHERWDGTGYPEGLSGEAIPIEARIMAIADVYDALVSRRVYKEAFDFEKADAIISEGMGTQFDPQLREVYEAARPRLEAYYSSQDN